MPLSVVPGRNPRGSADWTPVSPLIDPGDAREPNRARRAPRTNEFRQRDDAEEMRGVALERLSAAVEAAAGPLGYERLKWRWIKSTGRGETIVEVKRSHNGDRADLLLDARRPDGRHPPGPWRGARALNLGMFYHPRERAVLPFEAIAYEDILSGDGLEAPMRVLGERALPWLDNLHSGVGGLKQIEQFLPQL